MNYVRMKKIRGPNQSSGIASGIIRTGDPLIGGGKERIRLKGSVVITSNEKRRGRKPPWEWTSFALS